MAEMNVGEVVSTWLKSCERKGKISRNTVAVGIVILDHLLQKCPLSIEDGFSGTGSEVKGARSGLQTILNRHGIPEAYLKEATTRQASHDAQRLLEQLDFGRSLAKVSPDERQRLLAEGIGTLRENAFQWLRRQNLKVRCNKQDSPSFWIHTILTESEGKSSGKVEQHLVGAKLQKRHPRRAIPNHPGHAGDAQTGRHGDFDIDLMSYHVTANPGRDVIRKCKENVEGNRHAVLVVPREKVGHARALADDEGIGRRITILSLEDFIAENVIEISTENQTDFFSTLKDIIEEYNRRVEHAERDIALKIDLQ
jgi:hypothetical protein